MKAGALAARLASTVALVLERPGALRAMLRWPCFSLTSYRMVEDLRRQGVRPRTVIDVGANVGQFAVAALELWAPTSLHAFEPVEEAHEILRRHLARYPESKLHPVALGAQDGVLTFHVSSYSHSSSFLPFGERHRTEFPDARTLSDVDVPVRRLDAELAGHELPPPVLLKLDVQGYERWVLDGATATLAQAEWVVLEASYAPMYNGEPSFLELVQNMSLRGFRFERPVGWLVAPATGEILQCDALFRRIA